MLSLVLRRGFSRGLMDGNRAWLVAGTGALIVKGLQWAARREPEVVYRAEIEPGDTIVLAREKERPSPRRQRKVARADKRAAKADQPEAKKRR